jgi:hypothetical protein
MYNITIPVFIKSLSSLSGILDKVESEAKEKGFDLAHLLTDRLYPDMYNFTRQVQIACDSAKGTAARLADIEAPKMEDSEKTVEELKNRIDATIEFLKTIRPEQIEGSEDKKIPIWYLPGKYLTGFEYISEMYLPNFFFHLTSAYAILRHNGINLGKGDFLGDLSLKEEESK